MTKYVVVGTWWKTIEAKDISEAADKGWDGKPDHVTIYKIEKEK